MKYVFYLGLIFLAIVIQISLLPYLIGSYSGINIITILVITLVFVGKKKVALVWLGIGGILLDLYSPAKFGVYTIELIIAFLLADIFTKYFASKINFFPIFIFVFCFSFVTNLIWLYSEIEKYFLEVIKIAALSAFSNSLIASLIGWIFLKNEKKEHI